MGSERNRPSNGGAVTLFPLYLDEDSDAAALAETLRRVGVDVLRSRDAGMNGSPDSAQFAFAMSSGRVLYTANAGDFFTLHSTSLANGLDHPGILIWRRSAGHDIGEQARRILRAWVALSAENMRTRVEFLSHWGSDRT